MEYTKERRKYIYKDFEIIMAKIIRETKLTKEKEEEFIGVTLIGVTLPTLRKPGHNILDVLNIIIMIR